MLFVAQLIVLFSIFAILWLWLFTIKHYLSQLMRLWHLSHRRPAKAQASLRIHAVLPKPSLFTHMNYGSRLRVWQKIRYLPHWMTAHARLKNEFMEDEKCHNLMRWLIYFTSITQKAFWTSRCILEGNAVGVLWYNMMEETVVPKESQHSWMGYHF